MHVGTHEPARVYIRACVHGSLRGWVTSAQVSPSANSPMKAGVTQWESLRANAPWIGGGGNSPAAHTHHPSLLETLIIDQQIPNVNRAIRPENTDIHHPDTNYAAGPDVITRVQLDASSYPTLCPSTLLCGSFLLTGKAHLPDPRGSLWS